MSRLLKQLNKHKNEKHKESYLRFFKGQKVEGDYFLGVRVPTIRKVVKELNPSLEEAKVSINSKWHEERLASLYTFTFHFENASKENNTKLMEEIFSFLNNNHKGINNWDLVDSVVYKLHAIYLHKTKDEKQIKSYLKDLINENNLWRLRTAIVLNIYFVKIKETKYFNFILENIDEKSSHDLTKKAIKWVRTQSLKNTNK